MRPEEVHALARKHGLTHEQAIIATAIAWAESQLNPAAVGDVDLENDKWGPSVGLYQVRSLRADTGTGKERDIERLGDPSFNTRSMVAISSGGTNWTSWSMFTNGKYRQHLEAVRAAVTKGGTSMATVRGGIAVRPHVQSFADACQAATGASNFGTYNGHSPTADRALDIFVPVNSAELGTAICDFAIKNLEDYGVDYIIYRQRIYNPEVAPYWRGMPDRGDLTQNHYDHVHISFEPTAPKPGPVPAPIPTPEPEPIQEDDGMKLIAVSEGRGIFLAGETVEEDGKILARHVGSPNEVTALVESGAVVNYDKRPELPVAVFEAFYRQVG